MQLSVVIHRSSNFLRNNISSSFPPSSSPALSWFPGLVIFQTLVQFPSSLLCMPLIYALFTFDVFSLHLSTFSHFFTALTAGYPSAASSSQFYMTIMNFLHCLMFTCGENLLQVELKCPFTQTDVKTEEPPCQGSRNLPAPASGSAMKAVFERSQ